MIALAFLGGMCVGAMLGGIAVTLCVASHDSHAERQDDWRAAHAAHLNDPGLTDLGDR